MSEQSLRIAGLELWAGREFDLGHLTCSVDEIVEFARYVDPLPLHIDPEAASQGLFGGLVASGAQFYIEFHKRWFVPTLGASVLCGLGISGWNFLQPHLPNVSYQGRITVHEIAAKPEKGSCRVHWKYSFWAPDGSLAQEIEVRVLHRLDPVASSNG
jgi:acyl dehydratase